MVDRILRKHILIQFACGNLYDVKLLFYFNIRNQAEACFYISDHSDCELVVVENEE